MARYWQYWCACYECGITYRLNGKDIEVKTETGIIIRRGLCRKHRTRENIENLRETEKRKRREKK
jgi:hypothetical protein